MARLRRKLLSAGLAGILVSTLAPFTATPAVAAGPRIMVVGDSISQGMEGDYTWRYRLAQHFSAHGTAVDFVGPWTGTNVLPADLDSQGPNHSGAYRPGISFDNANLAQWGWQMHQAKDVIASRMTTYTPDYLLIELGFNDLAWGINSPDGLLQDFEWFVYWARTINPYIRIAVANVVHRTPMDIVPNLPADISSYNAKLAARVPQLSNFSSPVEMVDIDTPYDEYRDTYDGLHPGIRGEYVIAKAFADELSTGLGFGSPYGAIPTSLPAPLTPAAPTTVSATPVGDKMKMSWNHVFGATAFEYYQRDATVGGAFSKSIYDIGADSWTADLLPAGHRIEFYVKTRRGNWASSASAVAGATVKPLPEVQNVWTSVDPNRPYEVTIHWDPVVGADDYHVYSAPGCDIIPPSDSEYTLSQWNLGSRTSWTQTWVTSVCQNYKVAAVHYGGESPMPWAPMAQAVPYFGNFTHLLARNRYFDYPVDSGDQRGVTTTSAGTDRGIVVVRGFIKNNDAFTDGIGDHRGFDTNPYASAKIGVAYDTSTGDFGVYVHKSCVIGGSWPSPWSEGCKDARPVVFVADASAYGDSNDSPYNYVSKAWVNGSLVITVSAVNSWSSSLGRINAKIYLTPSGSTFAARIVGDKFPAWEVYRYPRGVRATENLDGLSYAIGTRDQTSISDLKSGAVSDCHSTPSELKNVASNPMYC